MLILTSDKQNAVRLRTMLEKMRLEFEIAIGEDTGRAILSERFMNLILIDASALKGGTSWVFSFLERRRLQVPIIILGAEESALKERPATLETIKFLPLPVDQARVEATLAELGAWGSSPVNRGFEHGRLPLASATGVFDDLD
jgi:DNA-binding NtrC family response regulator